MDANKSLSREKNVPGSIGGLKRKEQKAQHVLCSMKKQKQNVKIDEKARDREQDYSLILDSECRRYEALL